MKTSFESAIKIHVVRSEHPPFGQSLSKVLTCVRNRLQRTVPPCRNRHLRSEPVFPKHFSSTGSLSSEFNGCIGRPCKLQRGFSMLEMIAALTILAIGSMVLFSWLGQTTNQLTRFQNQEQESLARLQAIEYLSSQNPTLMPNGKQSFDTFNMTWKSERMSELRETVSPSEGLGLYQVGLYNVQVSTFDHSGRAWFGFQVKLAGFQQVRQPLNVPSFN